MVGISGCGSENTFWLSQTYGISPAALLSLPLSFFLSLWSCLCFSWAFVSKHKRFIAHMLAFVVHVLCESLCICSCLCVCVQHVHASVYVYVFMYASIPLCLFVSLHGCT